VTHHQKLFDFLSFSFFEIEGRVCFYPGAQIRSKAPVGDARGGTHVSVRAMKRSRGGALADRSVNAESPMRPETPGVACWSSGSGGAANDFSGDFIGEENRNQRLRTGYLGHGHPSCAEDSDALAMVRAAACVSGEHEVTRLVQSFSFPLNERVELALLELNLLMRMHRLNLAKLQV
tara:strand:- start:3083 stop:3613 length:531 start_codon:yes stop_codon:yes gene_type:complete